MMLTRGVRFPLPRGEALATGEGQLPPWLWLVPAVVGAALTALIMLVLPADRTLHGLGDFLLKVAPLVCAVLTIALFPSSTRWSMYLPVAGFLLYLGFIDSAFFIEVDHLVTAAQTQAVAAQFSSYYRFSIFANAFVVLWGVSAYRLGGGSSVQTLKLGCAGILVLVSGLNDLTMWAMYDWPDGVRPETFDWASHVSIFLGHPPRLSDMLAFFVIHLGLAAIVLRLPLERVVKLGAG
jgi:hypothetical protein